MSDDFCFYHGYEHMKFDFGNPVPHCAECHRLEAEVIAEFEAEHPDNIARCHMSPEEYRRRMDQKLDETMISDLKK
jgi:hypothetical protein